MNFQRYKHKKVAKLFLLILLLSSFATVGAQNENKKTEKFIADAKKILIDNPDSAIILLSKAETLALNDNDKQNLCEVYRRKANAYHYNGDYSTSLEYNFKALNLRETEKFTDSDSLNTAEKANIIYNIALNYQYLEEYVLAIEYASKLEPIYYELEDWGNLGLRCYSFIANIYYYIGDLIKAQEYTYKEVAIVEKNNNQEGISYSKDFLAMIKQDQGMNDEALKLQFESLEIRKKINDPILLSFSFNNIGTTYYRLKDYKNALIYLIKALEIREKYSDEQNLQSTLNNMGLVYQDMNETDKSLECFLRSYSICKKSDNIFGLATTSINLGIAYELKKDNANAEKYLSEAYDISVRNGYKSLIVQVTAFLSDFYKRQNRYKEAYEMLLLNGQYIDSTRNDDVIKELTRMEVEYKFNKKQAEDSITRQHEIVVSQAIHKEELKRKEQLVWILIAAFLFTIVIIFVLFKSYQYRRISAEKDLKQKALEIEKNLLKSQMNPHFIFNAMNSIQSFIAVNDTYSAERYLSKFARLIRMILENSTQQNVPLSDEIISLNLYMDLEKVRFNNKFNFEINLSDNIEEELISVPPMLIQPFVENAILHGIMHKETPGKITINIDDDEESQTLTCEITDDGIGRVAAAALKERYRADGKKHKSIGMQLTRERLDALNKETEVGMSCQIIDLNDENNKACGTKVIVKIPYSEIQNQ